MSNFSLQKQYIYKPKGNESKVSIASRTLFKHETLMNRKMLVKKMYVYTN